MPAPHTRNAVAVQIRRASGPPPPASVYAIELVTRPAVTVSPIWASHRARFTAVRANVSRTPRTAANAMTVSAAAIARYLVPGPSNP